MEKWTLAKTGKYKKKKDKSLEIIFSEEGGLYFFISQHLSSYSSNEGRFWLVFSKKEEKILDEIARKFYPIAGDIPCVLIRGILHNFRESFKTPLDATYIVSDWNILTTEANEKQLRLAICIGNK